MPVGHFIKEIKKMTVGAGQKCTGILEYLLPEMEDVQSDCNCTLETIGNPLNEKRRHGFCRRRDQRDDVLRCKILASSQTIYQAH
jgi:hypothetical protein